MKLTKTIIFASASLLALASCKQEVASEDKTTAPHAQTENFTVSAEVMYRERMLAPPGSSLTVTLEDVSIADKAADILSEEIIGIGKNLQLPLKVTLKTPKSELKPRHTYAFRARLEDPEGQLMWITTSRHSIDTSSSNDDLGKVLMQRVQSGVVDPQVNSLYPIPFKARGNEPGWLVDVQKDTITIQTNYGKNTIKTARPQPQPYKGGYKYHLEADGKVAIIDVQRKLCYDDMSGRPYPARVTLSLDGTLYEGCGGNPLDLLADAEWVVEDIANTGIIDHSRVTINFDRKGRAHGISTCNSYSAGYELTGETLTFKAPMGTLKACAPALMNQEQKFLDLLNKVSRYDIDGKGALILTTESGKTITARQH